jgi:hypothetical protein
MVALVIGIVFIAFAVFAVLSGGLGWWDYVVAFLKGCAPVLAVLIGFVAVFIGIADIKDKAEAKKEEAQEAKQQKEASK